MPVSYVGQVLPDVRGDHDLASDKPRSGRRKVLTSTASACHESFLT